MTIAEMRQAVQTPAWVIDERVILRALEQCDRIRRACGCRVLYALKALSAPFVLARMRGRIDGFSTSSLFESKLARSVLGGDGTVHITTPGFRACDLNALSEHCDFVAFNSLSQVRRFATAIGPDAKVGLRVNPGRSNLDDERYDPCRTASKLGVSLRQLAKALQRGEPELTALSGLLVHSHCDSDSFKPLDKTVRVIEKALDRHLDRFSWFNLGGGYLFDENTNLDALARMVERLRARYGLAVYFEPGAALVRQAGSLVTEVIDLFRSDGETIAVLDTTVNHVPEVFEYQFEPDLEEHTRNGRYSAFLVGSSCLAGDVLGRYAFDQPLKIGSRLVLRNLGAYSLVKSHMFNGINLPNIYAIDSGGALSLRRSFDYGDYLTHSGAKLDATI